MGNFCRYRDSTRPRQRRFGQDGKYENRRRDRERYREVIGKDEEPESCLDLSPFLQNQYQRRRAVTTRNDVRSVRLKKEYERTVDDSLKYREDVSYSTQKFPIGYEEDDYAPVDTVYTFVLFPSRSINIHLLAERYSPFYYRMYRRRIITIRRRATGERRKKMITDPLRSLEQ